jgi:Cytochrome C oxidase, cbb3-type, subunit III
VQRGYRPPPSFHDERLRTAAPGHFFDVITSGFGAMPDYRAQIAPRDRWAIVAYIRALQLAQRASTSDVLGGDPTKVPRPAPGGERRH